VAQSVGPEFKPKYQKKKERKTKKRKLISCYFPNKIFPLKSPGGWILVAHTYNPSYSGGKDQDCGLKPTWKKSLRDPISKKLNTKPGWQSGSSSRTPAYQAESQFKSQYHQKKKKGLGGWKAQW
jgi:hypothetical protein